MSTPESKLWKADFAGGVASYLNARWQMRYSVAMGDAGRTAILIFVVHATLVSFLLDNLHARIKKREADRAGSVSPPADAER